MGKQCRFTTTGRLVVLDSSIRPRFANFTDELRGRGMFTRQMHEILTNPNRDRLFEKNKRASALHAYLSRFKNGDIGLFYNNTIAEIDMNLESKKQHEQERQAKAGENTGRTNRAEKSMGTLAFVRKFFADEREIYLEEEKKHGDPSFISERLAMHAKHEIIDAVVLLRKSESAWGIEISYSNLPPWAQLPAMKETLNEQRFSHPITFSFKEAGVTAINGFPVLEIAGSENAFLFSHPVIAEAIAVLFGQENSGSGDGSATYSHNKYPSKHGCAP